MALACVDSEMVAPLTMFKAIRMQMDELGLQPDYRVHALSELPRVVAVQLSSNLMVRAFFAVKAPDILVIESTQSSGDRRARGRAYGVEPARIAKTLSLRVGDRVMLIVAAGTSRMDNKKLKAAFGGKPKMLGLR